MNPETAFLAVLIAAQIVLLVWHRMQIRRWERLHADIQRDLQEMVLRSVERKFHEAGVN